MELAWMDNAGFGGPRILKQNPSGPVWDMTLGIINPIPNNNSSSCTDHCHCCVVPTGSIWHYVIAKGTTLFEYMTQRNQLELNWKLPPC